jgi:hypothetical protein
MRHRNDLDTRPIPAAPPIDYDPEDFCVCGSHLDEHDSTTGRCLVLIGGIDRCTCRGFRHGTRSRKR